MKKLTKKTVLLISLICLVGCLPDSTTKWKEDKRKKTISSNDGSSSGPAPSGTSFNKLSYSQNIIVLKISFEDESVAGYSDIFNSDTIFYAGAIDGVTIGANIPENKYQPSGSSISEPRAIYITSAPDADGFFARGVVTALSEPTKVLYVKVLQGSFEKGQEINAKYYFYSKAAEIVEVTNFVTVDTAMNTISPIIDPPELTSNSLTYSIMPALPAGIDINYTTGVISGTPTEENSGEHTITARTIADGYTQSTKIKIVASKNPSGLSVTNKAILAVSSTAAFRELGYVSAPLTTPEDADNATPRTADYYPWGIIKEVISETALLVEVKNGEFEVGDLLDNSNSFTDTETYLVKAPIPTTAVLTVDEGLGGNLSVFDYDPSVDTTRKMVLAFTKTAANIGEPSIHSVSVTGSAVVTYFDSTPPTGTATRMYIRVVGGSFSKELDLYNDWDDSPASTDRGDILFVESDNLILGFDQGVCSDVARTTRKTCLDNVGGCSGGGHLSASTCKGGGEIWTPNYYAWTGVENFAAGVDISNATSSAVSHCGGAAPAYTCKGTGSVVYQDTTNREAHIRVSYGKFASGFTGNVSGGAVDDVNDYKASKGVIGTIRTAEHFTAYVGRPFIIKSSLSEGLNSTFDISPSIPEGLEFDNNTGILKGSASKAVERKLYTVTAKNSSSSQSTSFSFTMTVLTHFSVFVKGTASNDKSLTYIMHKAGRGNFFENCTVDSNQLAYGRSPTYPEVTKTRTIMCMVEAEELELFNEGIKLESHVDGGLCQYFVFEPYFFLSWPVQTSVSSQLRFRNNTGDCNARDQFERSIDGGVTWSAIGGERDIHGIGDYSLDNGPNCDAGSYYRDVRDRTINDAGACPGAELSGGDTFEAGGKWGNCISGAITDTDLDYTNGDRGKITLLENSNSDNKTYKKDWVFEAPNNKSHSNSQGYSSNLHLANYVSKNSCAGGEDFYGEENVYSYNFLNWYMYRNNITPIDSVEKFNKWSFDPFVGSNPFYMFQCLDAAREPIVRIYLAIREWDRSFTPISNMTDASDPTLNQWMDQLFPGAALPALGALTKYEHPDHLMDIDDRWIDPTDAGTYNDHDDWDDRFDWTNPTNDLNDYNSCSTTASRPQNISELIPFPLNDF